PIHASAKRRPASSDPGTFTPASSSSVPLLSRFASNPSASSSPIISRTIAKARSFRLSIYEYLPLSECRNVAAVTAKVPIYSPRRNRQSPIEQTPQIAAQKHRANRTFITIGQKDIGSFTHGHDGPSLVAGAGSLPEAAQNDYRTGNHVRSSKFTDIALNDDEHSPGLGADLPAGIAFNDDRSP